MGGFDLRCGAEALIDFHLRQMGDGVDERFACRRQRNRNRRATIIARRRQCIYVTVGDLGALRCDCISEATDCLQLGIGKRPSITERLNDIGGSANFGGKRRMDRDTVVRCSREESPEDRRVRVVALTAEGKDVITPLFQKHATLIKDVFSELSGKELQQFEAMLKRIGIRAQNMEDRKFKGEGK